jgi:NTP pyrophosphatase (non-canonical NTP hydrolase)
MKPEVQSAISDERRRQDEMWGPQRNLPDDTWYRILGEEFGEVATALNELASAKTAREKKAWRDNLREEIIQVAAVAAAWAEDYI